jgi:protein O-mannosyl-transferase
MSRPIGRHPIQLGPRSASFAVGLVLLLATLAVFGRTAAHPFVGWDDPDYVTQNSHVRSGWTRESVIWAFTDTEEVNWHPITWLSHMLDVEIHGGDAGGHHRTNVLIHFLNSVLVYALLLSMTGAVWRSAAVALLFAIHPLHVEVVAWISERKELLSTFFALLASLAYVAHVRRGCHWRSLLVLAFFALSLMAKAMMVTLPLVFLMLDYWPFRRPFSRALIVEKIPLLLLSGAASAIAVLTQEGAGAMVQIDLVPLLERIFNAILAYAHYMEKTVWPAGLIIFYPHPYISHTGGIRPSAIAIAGSAILLSAISLWVVRSANRPWARVGWFWFLGTLVPVIGVVQIGNQAMADRYMYFPSIGLFVLVVWGVDEIRDRMSSSAPATASIALASALAMVVLGVVAWHQTGYWRDSIALFRHGIEVEPRNVTLRFNVANHLRDEGRFDDAAAQYRLILEITPDASGPNLNLGNLLRGQGRLDDAIAHYERALRAEPDYVLARVNLASALAGRGRIDEAIAHYERALREAVREYERSLELSPNDARIRNNLGLSLLADRQLDAAIAQFRAALLLRQDHGDTVNNLGVALEEQGNINDAIAAYRRAIAINPDHARAHANLGLLLAARAERKEAQTHLSRALELDPGNPEARAAIATLSSGSPRETASQTPPSPRASPPATSSSP